MEEGVKLYGKLNRRSHRVSRDQLDAAVPSLNLERIEVQATSPTDPDARVAVDVRLCWPDEEEQAGDELLLEALNEGESVLIVQPDIRAKLERRSVGWLGATWWLVLLILLALAIWAGIFGYLYWMA